MDQALREFVRTRARHRCEYCGLSQAAQPFHRFHIEHVIARQHGGGDEADNLALACHHCNLHKGPNLSAFDPFSSQLVTLFHPRLQKWDDHFRLAECLVVGLTPIGRATIALLDMNSSARVRLRFVIQESDDPA